MIGFENRLNDIFKRYTNKLKKIIITGISNERRNAVGIEATFLRYDN